MKRMKWWYEMDYQERQDAIAAMVIMAFWIGVGVGITLLLQYLF